MISGFIALVFTMWTRASFALLVLFGAVLADATAFAQAIRKIQAQDEFQTPRNGLMFLNVARPGAGLARPARRPDMIVVGNITRAQAVRAAIRCNRGGEALKPPVRQGQGFVVKVLKGSYVRFIRVDKDGQCG
ncbi:hypothetical protein MNBD_ALPHA09-261 [hydrothermal vent metagenome]|uniref:Uncharacterized protein n=1 Tax=hydrothermal vent metagenome TaxID=652676 RepID=A0A3B0TPJ8_9ZZZZ